MKIKDPFTAIEDPWHPVWFAWFSKKIVQMCAYSVFDASTAWSNQNQIWPQWKTNTQKHYMKKMQQAYYCTGFDSHPKACGCHGKLVSRKLDLNDANSCFQAWQPIMAWCMCGRWRWSAWTESDSNLQIPLFYERNQTASPYHFLWCPYPPCNPYSYVRSLYHAAFCHTHSSNLEWDENFLFRTDRKRIEQQTAYFLLQYTINQCTALCYHMLF